MTNEKPVTHDSDAECSMEADGAAKVIRGKPKSKRVWKQVQKEPFRARRKDAAFHKSWQAKRAASSEQQVVRALATEIKDQRKRVKTANRERRVLNKQRRIENERKSEIVQVIRNTSKLKKIKKKQLRQIQKRDTNPVNT